MIIIRFDGDDLMCVLLCCQTDTYDDFDFCYD